MGQTKPRRKGETVITLTFTDDERQLIVTLLLRDLVRIRTDPGMQPQARELAGILEKLSGTDTVLVARRAYPARRAQAAGDPLRRRAISAAEAAYRDNSCSERVCDNPACNTVYRGPAVYCSLECALGDV